MKHKFIFLFFIILFCSCPTVYACKPSEQNEWTTYKASFYNQSCKTCIYTKSGRKVEHGKTLAVDPKVIPLGSIVEIKYSSGKKEIRRADDTGRLIKGKKVDVFYNYSRKTLLKMGVQKVQIRIISYPKKHLKGGA